MPLKPETLTEQRVTRKLSWLDRITFRALAGSLVILGATSMSAPPVALGADICVEIGEISSCDI
jgi:hypothetical protein